MSDILSLAPQNVWKHFYSLTQVPRPSGQLEKIQAFLLEFGKSVGVESFHDEAGNIIYRKPATPGMENRKTVILQAHMDMVPQKNKDTEHDFEKDPIQAYVEDGWVRAKGTTLGADDGMGVAAIMAVMEDKTLKHGPLTALITADDYPIAQSILAGKLMALTGLRIAGDPQKLGVIKEEFAKNYRE